MNRPSYSSATWHARSTKNIWAMMFESMEELLDGRRPSSHLAAYFGLTLAITWGRGATLIFAKTQLEEMIGAMGPINHPWLYYLAARTRDFGGDAKSGVRRMV